MIEATQSSVEKNAKFIKGLNVKKPITLRLLASIDNRNLKEKALTAFVGLVNRHKSRIKELEIIVGCYLQRYYVGEEKASLLFEEWKLKNRESLINLDGSISLKITSWKAIVEDEKFEDASGKVKKLYDEDSAYKCKVDLQAKGHKHQAPFENAKDYLLEENAAFMFLEGHFAYPSQHLNAANLHIVENYNQDFIFHGYSIFEAKNKTSPRKNLKNSDSDSDDSDSDKLMVTCIRAATLMEKCGIFGAKEQEEYFKKFLAAREQCAIKTAVNEQGAPKYP